LRSLTLTGCALLAAGLLAAGCGGGDDNLTKAEFTNQADAICKKGNQEIDKAAKQVFTSKQAPSKAQFEKLVNDTLIPNTQSQIDQIRDLNPPSADEDQVNALLEEAQSALDEVKQDPTVLQSNKDPFKKANQLANDYGLKACGNG
jgi:putative heme degradation protein